jgi:protocatechuate 3,4-dioxygenase beta subunit
MEPTCPRLPHPRLSRRGAVRFGLAGFAGLLWWPGWADPAQAASCRFTEAQTAGPYYRPGAPDRADLRPAGTDAQELLLTLEARGRDCEPLAPALIDLWHADPRGNYDLQGFLFRTRHLSERPSAQILTYVPGRYPGRTCHIHVAVSAPGYRPLITQLYFPDDPFNGRDTLFRKALLLDLGTGRRRSERLSGAYTFYLEPR